MIFDQIQCHHPHSYHWEFQDPKMEVLYHFSGHIRPINRFLEWPLIISQVFLPMNLPRMARDLFSETGHAGSNWSLGRSGHVVGQRYWSFGEKRGTVFTGNQTEGIFPEVYPLVNKQKAMENHHFSWENSLFKWPFSIAMVNKQLDPENHQFLMETNLPTPMTARVVMLIYQRVCFGIRV